MSPIKKKRERDSKYTIQARAPVTIGSCQSTHKMHLEKARTVRFSQDEIIHKVPSYEDLEAHEWSLLWYTPEDYKIFNDQCEVSAKKMQTDGIRSNSKRLGSSYGLENWTKDGFRKCIRNRKESVHVVLQEQFAQWGDGVDDSNSIAELYAARCQHVEMVALTRGLMLEREVQKLQAKAMLETPRLFSSLSLKQQSPYIEKMRLLTTRSQFSSRHYDCEVYSETSQKWTQLTKPNGGSTTAQVDSENLAQPATNDSFSSQIRMALPFSPRPSLNTQTKKRKS